VWADLGDGWRLADVFCEPPAAALARGGDSGGFQVKVGSRDFEFRFQVHDEAGRPVAGALVHLVAGEESAPIGHLPPRRTNAAGELNWQPFTYGAWQVDISSPGYAPVRTSPYQFLHTDAPGRRYRVQLRAGREVVVEVLGEDSARAAGAEVEFAYANLNLPTFSRWAVKADAQGRAVITVPRGEGAVVSARLPGLEAEVVTSDDTDRVTLRLRAVDARQR